MCKNCSCRAFQEILDKSGRKSRKYEYVKAVSFITDQLNHDYKIMIEKCFQHISNRNLLLLKDLLEP